MKPSQSEADSRFMAEALRLAAKGEGRTRPNPPVGAIVVRGGKIVGSGWHRRAGGSHAEVLALKSAGAKARGATLYVTLEPCSTEGRTPACTEAILAGGVQRVVVATRDPNPRHRGRGIRLLKRAGLEVSEGVSHDSARRLIAPFSKHIRTGRPYVTLKLAITLDGKIADARGSARWISSPASRAIVQQLRSRADAVMVGGGTVRSDDPQLLCRSRKSHKLHRVILTTDGSIPLNARILTDKAREQTIVVTSVTCPRKKVLAYESTGATVWKLARTRDGVSIKKTLARLGDMGLLHVLCEGGSGLAASLVQQKVVDEYVFFVAPKLLGEGALSAFGGPGWPLRTCPEIEIMKTERAGPDLVVYAKPAG